MCFLPLKGCCDERAVAVADTAVCSWGNDDGGAPFGASEKKEEEEESRAPMPPIEDGKPASKLLLMRLSWLLPPALKLKEDCLFGAFGEEPPPTNTPLTADEGEKSVGD